jgi:hypothetical protein
LLHIPPQVGSPRNPYKYRAAVSSLYLFSYSMGFSALGHISGADVKKLGRQRFNVVYCCVLMSGLFFGLASSSTIFINSKLLKI